LDSTIIRINELLKFVNEKNSVTQNFLLAYRMEFYMLNRIFSTLFHFIKTFSDEKSPEDSYEDHIKRFIMKINQYKHDSLELELLSETISKLWYDNKHLAILTTHDPLTNLLNRNGLFNSMNILLHLAMRNNYLVGIMMIDIDFFKKINDTYGHQKGDEILVQVSRIIKENVRRSDIVGRYGGEEILVFLFNIDKNGLIKTGDKIRRSIENETRDSVPVTVSIGVSYDYIDSNPQEKVQELIKKADDNLYKAKRMGRNQVVYIKNR
jgi:diguanylate cyclase (GGDEF)-like protein